MVPGLLFTPAWTPQERFGFGHARTRGLIERAERPSEAPVYAKAQTNPRQRILRWSRDRTRHRIRAEVAEMLTSWLSARHTDRSSRNPGHSSSTSGRPSNRAANGAKIASCVTNTCRPVSCSRAADSSPRSRCSYRERRDDRWHPVVQHTPEDHDVDLANDAWSSPRSGGRSTTSVAPVTSMTSSPPSSVSTRAWPL